MSVLSEIVLESASRINSLKSGIEAVTGETYTDLTEGVQALKDGYGQGGGGEELAALETKIDESGVLDGTEQSLDEKVDGLIDRAEDESIWYEASKNWKTNFNCLFMGYTNMKKLPRLSFENATNATSMLDGSGLETVDIYLDTAKVTNFYQMFHKSTSLKSIVGLNTSNGTNFYGCFAHCYALETIEEPLDLSKATSVMAMFNRCDALANVLFVSGSIGLSIQIPSGKLSDASIQSIVDGLADLTGGTTQTLTLNALVIAKLTEAQIATITSKNWVVA